MSFLTSLSHPGRTKSQCGYKATITRTKGFIGKNQMEVTRYPEAIHHINIFFNDLGKARIFYKYDGSIRFLKTEKKA